MWSVEAARDRGSPSAPRLSTHFITTSDSLSTGFSSGLGGEMGKGYLTRQGGGKEISGGGEVEAGKGDREMREGQQTLTMYGKATRRPDTTL